jgi:NAD(P)-dependent dehydrogenase (short-subunit alcohol dehydrogenase family)
MTGGDQVSTAVQDKGAVIVTGASRGIGAAIAGRLADDGYGVIVNYATDALVTFARGMSNEVASEGIRSNSVSPGVIETEMAYPKVQELAKHGPLGRLGRPDEIAATVSWLVSPEASYVTGSDITVSGGL